VNVVVFAPVFNQYTTLVTVLAIFLSIVEFKYALAMIEIFNIINTAID
jgi:hypothetical protein